MKRKEKDQPKRMTDAIHCGIMKETTVVPNYILRTPEMSSKAKSLICLLLSNKEGWTSYLTTIKKMMKEGTDAINSGLKELEEFGFLARIRYRDKQTKIWRGSFWAYTDSPFQFDLADKLKEIEEKNCEIYVNREVYPQPENPDVENPDVVFPDVENPALKILNIKNTKLLKIPKEEVVASTNQEKEKNKPSKNGYITPNMFEKFWKLYPKKVNKGDAKKKWKDICTQKSWEKDRPKWRTVAVAISQQKESEQWQEIKYIPHPVTWLNKLRWLNDASQMKVPQINETKNIPSNAYKGDTKKKYSY